MKRPQFPQFRLRTLFVLLVLSAVALSVYLRWMREPRAIARLERQGVRFGMWGKPKSEWRRDRRPVRFIDLEHATAPDLMFLKDVKDVGCLNANSTNWSKIDTKSLAQCPALRCVCGSYSTSTGSLFRATQQHPNLGYLLVRWSDLEDADLEFANPGLVSLEVEGCRISDKGMVWIGKLAGLKELGIETPLVTDAGIAELRSCTELEVLRLGKGTSCSDKIFATVGKLPKLKTLQVDSNRFTDQGLLTLKSHPTLKTISISGGEISAESLAELRSALVLPLSKRPAFGF